MRASISTHSLQRIRSGSLTRRSWEDTRRKSRALALVHCVRASLMVTCQPCERHVLGFPCTLPGFLFLRCTAFIPACWSRAKHRQFTCTARAAHYLPSFLFFLFIALVSACWFDNMCSISFTLRMRSASLEKNEKWHVMTRRWRTQANYSCNFVTRVSKKFTKRPWQQLFELKALFEL